MPRAPGPGTHHTGRSKDPGQVKQSPSPLDILSTLHSLGLTHPAPMHLLAQGSGLGNLSSTKSLVSRAHRPRTHHIDGPKDPRQMTQCPSYKSCSQPQISHGVARLQPCLARSAFSPDFCMHWQQHVLQPASACFLQVPVHASVKWVPVS